MNKIKLSDEVLMYNLPIIDAHHHFWDLDLNKHPWLCSNQNISFRYGDYSSIKASYLKNDYFRDSMNHKIVKTIHVEAEWDPSDSVSETDWLTSYFDKNGYPNAIVGRVQFERDDIEKIIKGHCKSPLIRSVRQKPRVQPFQNRYLSDVKGGMSEDLFRRGYKLLCKYKLHYDLQVPWWHLSEAAILANDFPDTLIILNHTGLPSDRSKKGAR